MSVLSVLKGIGSNVGGFFKNNSSSIFSALGSAGSGLFSNATTGKQQRRAYEYARALQQQQYDLSLQGFREAPTAQREGLTTAGYNPMLALGNVGSGVSVAGGTPVNSNATDVSGIKEAFSTAVQLKNQTEQTKASTDQMYAEADKAKAEKSTIMARLPYVSKQAKADYIKTQAEAAKLENDIHYQNEYINYLKSSLTNAKEIALIEAEAKKYAADTGASATRYSANKSYNASTYASNVAAESTPFRYATKNAGNIIRNVYDFYDKTNRFIYGRR